MAVDQTTYIDAMRLSVKNLAERIFRPAVEAKRVGEIISRAKRDHTETRPGFGGGAHQSIDYLVNCAITTSRDDQLIAFLGSLVSQFSGMGWKNSAAPICAAILLDNRTQICGGLPGATEVGIGINN
jgi:hypothetical protein